MLWTCGALKEYGRIGSELIDHLPASSARRTGDSMVVGDGYRLNLNFWAQGSDRSEYCGSLGAVGHAVGGVLHIAARKNFAIRQQNCRPNMEVRVWSVRIFHHFNRCLLQ